MPITETDGHQSAVCFEELNLSLAVGLVWMIFRIEFLRQSLLRLPLTLQLAVEQDGCEGHQDAEGGEVSGHGLPAVTINIFLISLYYDKV